MAVFWLYYLGLGIGSLGWALPLLFGLCPLSLLGLVPFMCFGFGPLTAFIQPLVEFLFSFPLLDIPFVDFLKKLCCL